MNKSKTKVEVTEMKKPEFVNAGAPATNSKQVMNGTFYEWNIAKPDRWRSLCLTNPGKTVQRCSYGWNSTKTTLLFLNVKQDFPIEIKIGDSSVSREPSAKLLGMNVTDELKWIHHTNVITAALNKRYYLISRLKN